MAPIENIQWDNIPSTSTVQPLQMNMIPDITIEATDNAISLKTKNIVRKPKLIVQGIIKHAQFINKHKKDTVA